MIEFMPTTPVALSLLVLVATPILVLLLSYGSWKVASPGKRFVFAALGGWTIWLFCMVASDPTVVELITGFLLLVTATLVQFTLWTLLAWGFTLSMLLALHRAGQPLLLEEWVQAYTGGKPLSAFAEDRIQLLLRLRLAELTDRQLVMSRGRGRLIAQLTQRLRRLFGLSK